jgi:hypothetical protein
MLLLCYLQIVVAEISLQFHSYMYEVGKAEYAGGSQSGGGGGMARPC